MSEDKPKKRIGVKRWIILALFGVGIYCAFMGPSILKPISPVVVLPPEPIGIFIGNFELTNTILATLLADLLLILIAIGAYRFVKSGKLVPGGFFNAFEAIFEFMWNSIEGTAGKWAKRIFPIPATIFLLVLIANMIKLVPGFESVGILEQVKLGKGYGAVELLQTAKRAVYTIDKGQPGVSVAVGEVATEEHAAVCTVCEVIPFLRGSATDLNFPLALALITVISVQAYGVWSLGPGYFSKFLPVKQLVSGGIFGLINFAVGFLEIILELAKILSFSFRLFGNIFAGVLLLSIIGALIPVVIPPLLYIFEVFFGAIQAYVFFLLATVFMSGAIISHHAEE